MGVFSFINEEIEDVGVKCYGLGKQLVNGCWSLGLKYLTSNIVYFLAQYDEMQKQNTVVTTKC
jgi:hypothetical protein